jgi:membrane-associated phospholipid phosphatase
MPEGALPTPCVIHNSDFIPVRRLAASAIWIFICRRNAYLYRMIELQKLRQNSLFWLLAGAVLVALAWPFDNRVDAVLDVTNKPWWHQIAWWCSKIGEGWVVGAAGIFCAVFFLLMNRPQIAAGIFFAALTSELTGLAATILRVLLGRTRPSTHDVPPGFYGVWHQGHWIVGQFKFSAFPSGHAATAVGLAAAVWLIHRGWGAVAAVYALAVMWSRIALQCHHLSDVAASAVLAVPLAMLSKRFLAPSVEFQFGNLHRAWKKSKPSGQISLQSKNSSGVNGHVVGKPCRSNNR